MDIAILTPEQFGKLRQFISGAFGLDMTLGPHRDVDAVPTDGRDQLSGLLGRVLLK